MNHLLSSEKLRLVVERPAQKPHVGMRYHVCQVVQARAVGSLDDMVLIAGPLDGHGAEDVVGEAACPLARHLEAYNSLTALGLELGPLRLRLRHPLSAVQKRA